jgi:hypothetical protein
MKEVQNMRKLLILVMAMLFFIPTQCYALQQSDWQLVKSSSSIDVFCDSNNSYEKSSVVYVWSKTYYKNSYDSQKNIQLLKKAGIEPTKVNLSYSVELGKFFADNGIEYYYPLHVEFYDVDGNSIYSIDASSTTSTSTTSSTSSTTVDAQMVVPDSILGKEFQLVTNALALKNPVSTQTTQIST